VSPAFLPRQRRRVARAHQRRPGTHCSTDPRSGLNGSARLTQHDRYTSSHYRD
jgi:hypothetical protein